MRDRSRAGGDMKRKVESSVSGESQLPRLGAEGVFRGSSWRGAHQESIIY